MSRHFTDLHLHLLPGVDDGPRDMDESVALARELVLDGVARATVTPHFNAWNPGRLTSLEQVNNELDQLRPVLAAQDVQLELFPGAEHFLTPELIDQLNDGVAPLLGSGPYILVELPFRDRPLYAESLLKDISRLGLLPVLAHPERYAWVQREPDAIRDLTDLGVILQCTAGGVGGQYGEKVKKTAEWIIGHGLCHLVGSDRHRPEQSRGLTDMTARLAGLVGEGAAEVMGRENPARVLQSETMIDPGVADQGAPQRRLFGIFDL